jgi:putative membrane protein
LIKETIVKAKPWIHLTAKAIAIACCSSLCASASAAGLSSSDTDFMKKAAQAGQMEIQASRLAQGKATNSSVKAFAEQMLKDHGAADADLKQLAGTKGVTLPASPAPSDQKKLESLGALNGQSFDRQYADEIGVKAHNEAVSLFRKASTGANDPDVKAFAGKTLPTLEHHLEMAKSMVGAVGK